MSKGTLTEAPFLPASPPKAAVIDLGGLLSQQELVSLQTQLTALNYKAKVLILPRDFSAASSQQFAIDLAKQWQVTGNRLLMVVDLKGHNVRVVPGSGLQSKGITGKFLSNEIIPKHFIPNVKAGDIEGAIQQTLLGIDATIGKQSQELSQGSSSSYQGMKERGSGFPSNTVSGAGTEGNFFFLGFIVIIAVAIFAAVVHSRNQENKKLASKLNEHLDALYEQADQIGQSSEYLEKEKYPELALKVAEYFNRLNVLSKAKGEVDRLQKGLKAWKTQAGLNNCLRLSELLAQESQSLLVELNAATGGVQSYVSSLATRPHDIETLIERGNQADESKFYRPAWTYEPAYAAQVQPYAAPYLGGFAAGSGLFDMMLVLNQLETNRRLDDLSYQMHHQQGPVWNTANTDFGSGSWEPTATSDDWGSADIGGGDFGSADFGGGDFGGDGGGGSW